MGVSENSVALNPMVLLIIIPIKWLFVWEIYPIFRQTHIYIWLWINTYFYTIFSGMNIHKSQLF